MSSASNATLIAPRTGARHPTGVPREVIVALETGQESVNHMEQIAMDMGNLLAWQFPGGRLGPQLDVFADEAMQHFLQVAD